MARIIQVTGIRKVEIREAPDPQLGEGDILIQPHFLGISIGTELNTYRGGVNWHSGRDQHRLFRNGVEAEPWTYPANLGYANVGRILAVGPGVRDRTPGEMVFSTAGHRSPAVARTTNTWAVPTGADPRRYVFYQLIRTALNVVHHAKPALGDTVVVFGLGVVGLLTVALARRAGAGRIIALDLIEKRRMMAVRMGATELLDPQAEDPAYAIRRLNEGRAADVAIECSANPAAVREATRAVDTRGRVILASMPNRSAPFHFGQEVHFNAVNITGANVMQLPHDLGPRWDMDRRDAYARSLISEIDVLPLITHEFTFDEAPAAYALIDQNPSDVISVILRCPEAVQATTIGSNG